MAEERSLPGWPKKKLVKDVRRHLWRYGIRPTRSDLWRATWAWAEKISRSYWHVHWPQAWEIGTQYMLLLLIQMKENRCLRLPYRASDHIPPEVAALLPITQQPEFLAIADEAGKKRTRRRSNGEQRDTGQPTIGNEQPTPS